ncbi:ATP-binding cassette domain-containing protein [Weissella diestrammenae]|uniref:ATP-binding cassette domain-containing protein n=1 Tax=Weissella diestrammenae TaxID=1162633 RepID=A0A7G9T4A6_9LACO|nr:ATP-binding cassette domain-containing protein [Weissella diestrammenae]MCM0583463.1 ATP-binding cassette domain-containing protein [Weissella diestrammenae]QNN74931.1 ATP-binding cassette domain-containing protein [Weissella diestrammenae]
MIEVKGLDKSFHGNQILNGINLKVDNGRITALIGKNGAGKSTLIGCVCHYFEIDAGSILNADVSVMPDVDNLYRDMTGRQFLKYMTRIKRKGTFDYLSMVKRLGIVEELDNKIKSYSFGMK